MEKYIWHVWFSWVVEERINALGWWAEVSGDESVRARVREEVLSIARWPKHFGGNAGGPEFTPGLGMSHLLRMMLNARRNWAWLGEEVGAEIVRACARAVETKKPWMQGIVKTYQDAEQIRAFDVVKQAEITKNIPVIGAGMLAMAAEAARETVGEEMVETLRRHFLAMQRIRLDLVVAGHTEAIAYDGYVMDFMADWLATVPAGSEFARTFSQHQAVKKQLAMPAELAAPGDVLNVANLSDVEPKEMTFYVTGAAKMGRLFGLDRDTAWFLGRCRLDWLRAEALGLMHGMEDKLMEAPAAGARKGSYTVSLRSGYAEEDLAVVMAAGRSVMHHIHQDIGSIVIGHRGVWLLADPGYQQYLQRREREFTLNARAHNCPVINGLMQEERGKAVVLGAEAVGDGIWRMGVDMAPSYGPQAKVTAARRWVWLKGAEAVVVCDVIEGAVEKVEYTWHGLPEAGWWAEGGKALIEHAGAELWMSCSRVALQQEMIDRRPGSRGHLSLTAEVNGDGKRVVCWWGFGLGKPVDWKVEGERVFLNGVELKQG
jgi:hypothetical protein